MFAADHYSGADRLEAGRRAAPPLRRPAAHPGAGALFLSEAVSELNEGANFLERLSPAEMVQLRARGRQFPVKSGDPVFTQGTKHEGIYLIDKGRVRVFYSAPSGREITLAYWTPGHFVAGPEIFSGGLHVWSGEAIEDCRVTLVPNGAVEDLIRQMPNFALCLIQGLVAKGKCYSSMAQILGTRSVIERLAQYLVTLSELYGVSEGERIVINHKVTHDQIAAMVGSTRQWVTLMLKRFKKQGILSIEGRCIRVDRPARLREILDRGDE